MIEKRLRHLRQQLQNLTKLQMPHTTSNLLAEHDSDDYDEHQRQYKQRLHQLLILYDKQVWEEILEYRRFSYVAILGDKFESLA